MRKTTEEIAREAGCEHNGRGWTYRYGTLPELLETFRRLVIENERECAEAVAIVGELSPATRKEALEKGIALGAYLFTFPPAAQVPGWQPIETAPKDGTPILLRSKKGRIADGVWNEVSSTVGFWAWSYINVEPAFWMPLPAAPERV